MKKITYAAHVAYLDPMTGQGLLVLPEPTDDLYGLATADPSAPIPGAVSAEAYSLHSADLASAVRDLRAAGWVLAEDEDGWTPLTVGEDAHGRAVVALCGLSPIIGEPSLDEMAEADRELAELAGLVR